LTFYPQFLHFSISILPIAIRIRRIADVAQAASRFFCMDVWPGSARQNMNSPHFPILCKFSATPAGVFRETIAISLSYFAVCAKHGAIKK
jgi:hypothetical protein